VEHKLEHPELTRLKAELGPAKYAKALAMAMEYREYQRAMLAGPRLVLTYETKIIARVLEEHLP